MNICEGRERERERVRERGRKREKYKVEAAMRLSSIITENTVY